MGIFEKKLRVSCSQEELYAFHTDLRNLLKLTPQKSSVTLLDAIVHPKEGSTFRLRVVEKFIPMTWEIKIQTMKKPHLLVDVALRSPFAFWRHTHRFESLEDGTSLLTDSVEYELPFGALGRVFNFLVEYELAKLFTHRHLVTKKILEEERG